MGIAGSIAWIIFGALYILYRFYKDDPGQTLTYVIVCGIAASAIIGWCSVTAFLTKHTPVGSVIWVVAWMTALIVFLVKNNIEQAEQKAKIQRDWDRIDEILAEMPYSEEEFEEYLKKWRRGSSMDQIRFDLIKTPEAQAEGRAKALQSFYLSTGMYQKAREQMLAEKKAAENAEEEEPEEAEEPKTHWWE